MRQLGPQSGDKITSRVRYIKPNGSDCRSRALDFYGDCQMETKKCGKCLIVKPIKEFCKHHRGDYQSYCKKCREYARQYRQTPQRKAYNQKWGKSAQRIAYNKEYYQRPEVKAHRAEKMRQYVNDPKNRYKHKARWAVGRAKTRKNNQLKPGPCAFCEIPPPTEAHHTDYSKPLEIIWLCQKCHRDLHKALKAAATK